jgi:hypothetical protein
MNLGTPNARDASSHPPCAVMPRGRLPLAGPLNRSPRTSRQEKLLSKAQSPSSRGLLWVKMSRATHLVGTADLPQSADPPGRRSVLPSWAKSCHSAAHRRSGSFWRVLLLLIDVITLAGITYSRPFVGNGRGEPL